MPAAPGAVEAVPTINAQAFGIAALLYDVDPAIYEAVSAFTAFSDRLAHDELTAYVV